MPYIQRNEKGEIIALTADSTGQDDQPVGLDNPEILQFLAETTILQKAITISKCWPRIFNRFVFWKI